MAAISLYRKYRPQTFAEVKGQDHVTATLAQAVAEGRAHHAYLFTGPRGTGKTSTARILAKSLNCEQGPTTEPCNACAHCTQITTGSHVDVIEIDAASHGGVDDVRDLRDRVAFAPAQARLKVYIVDECHMLSTAGWNAFLKTVEEPPGHVVFVFATTEPHKVLPTILSRTQRFDFKRVDALTLASLSGDLAEREDLALEDGALDLIVRAGDGSVRDTLSVLEQVVAFTGREVTIAGVAEVLGSIPDELLADAAERIADGDVAGACALVGRVVAAGHDLRQFARDAVEHLRSLFLLQVAPEAGLVSTTPERLARLQAQSGRLGRVELLRAIELLVDAQGQMRRGQTRLPLEVALAKAAMPESAGDAAALAARLERLERRPEAGQAAAPEPEAAPSPEPEAVSAPEPSPVEPALPPEPAPEEELPPEPAPQQELPPESAPGEEVFPEPAPESEPAPEPAQELPPEPEPAPEQELPPEPALEQEPAPEPASTGDPAPDPAPALDPAPASGGQRAPAQTPDSGDVDLAAVQRAWEAVLDALKQHKKRWHAFASMSRPVALDGSQLTLEFRAGYGLHAEQCASEAGQEAIGSALERALGTRFRLRCTVADAQQARSEAEASNDTASVGDPSPEAQEVAEVEAEEAAGDLPDDETSHDAAIARLQSDLGAKIVDDDRA